MLQRKSSNLKGEQCMRKWLPKTLRELIFACPLSAVGRYSGGSCLFHCTIGNVCVPDLWVTWALQKMTQEKAERGLLTSVFNTKLKFVLCP